MVEQHAPLLLYLVTGLSSVLTVLLGFMIKGWMAQIQAQLQGIHDCQEGLRVDINRLDRRLTRVETKVGLFHEETED